MGNFKQNFLDKPREFGFYHLLAFLVQSIITCNDIYTMILMIISPFDNASIDSASMVNLHFISSCECAIE